MSTVLTPPLREWTVADLHEQFGPILHTRIRQDPAPGTATEEDVVAIYDREKRLYELIEGVLVEKTMGVQESFLAACLIQILGEFVRREKLGFVLGADGMTRLFPGIVRIPDVSFVSWSQTPSHRVPKGAMLEIAPDLAVEIISPSNTVKEMDHKLRDYFAAGVRRVWYVDPEPRNVRVFSSVEQMTLLSEEQSLTGEPLLPGFSLNLRELFAELEK